MSYDLIGHISLSNFKAYILPEVKIGILPALIIATSPLWLSTVPSPDNWNIKWPLEEKTMHQTVPDHCIANRSPKELESIYRTAEKEYAIQHSILLSQLNDPLPEVLRREMNDVCLSSDFVREAIDLGIKQNKPNPFKLATKELFDHPSTPKCTEEPATNQSNPTLLSNRQKIIDAYKAKLRRDNMTAVKNHSFQVTNPYYRTNSPQAKLKN